MTETSYAVVDFETTGFSPYRHHRIVEIGVVILDARGNITDAWESVINPERQVDASEIHGLTGKELASAPKFDEVAGTLTDLLAGKVLVAHNLPFDAMFLNSELKRMGVNLELDGSSGLCTMQLAGRYLNSDRLRLTDCCKCIGIEHNNSHTALDDAKAAAGLLASYIGQNSGFRAEWSDVVARSLSIQWPLLKASKKAVPRDVAVKKSKRHFVESLVSRSLRANLYPEANSYIEVLDRALIDKHLSEHEILELLVVANHLGLSCEEAQRLHADYFNGLVRLAFEDGVLTDQEKNDLVKVARCLGLDEVTALSSERQETAPDYRSKTFQGPSISVGDSVVFTGESDCSSRDELIEQAHSLGIRVASAVSKKTKLLIAADPDSLSGKARKARELGVPIIGYEQYIALIKISF